MKVFANSVDTIIAEDLDDVRKVLIEMNGSLEGMEDEGDWHEYPPDKVITIHDNEGDLRARGFTTTTNPRSGHECVSRTAAEWIESEGRGLLCSTEY